MSGPVLYCSIGREACTPCVRVKIMPNEWRRTIKFNSCMGTQKIDFTVDEGKGRLHPSRDKN